MPALARNSRLYRKETPAARDSNPEQWPEEIRKEDIRLMRKAGVSFVNAAIFDWARLRSDEKTYAFEWLDGA
jgi:beta-galactosidase